MAKRKRGELERAVETILADPRAGSSKIIVILIIRTYYTILIIVILIVILIIQILVFG